MFFRRVVNQTVVRHARMMSGHSTEAAAEGVKRWTKMTFGMTGLCVLFGIYNIVFHDHEHVRLGLPYQKIRTKPYPWGCSDCNLFDLECWAECRGEGKPKGDDHGH